LKIANYLSKLRQNKAVLAVLLILLVVFATSSYVLSGFNPGFEGAKCYFYGAYFPSASWEGYSPTDTLIKYQDPETLVLRDTHMEGLGNVTNTVSWTTRATPTDAGLGSLWKLQPLWGGASKRAKPQMNIKVESNLQLQDIDRQGDPLNWNTSNPMDARRIEYWDRKAVQISQVNDTDSKALITTYSYNLTKESFILAPVEFWVGFTLGPSQIDALTSSGWTEGEWNNFVVWFMLDFNVWNNAYKDAWLDDPAQNVFNSEFNGSILNQNKLAEFRGGFPIAGGIQGWEKADMTSGLTKATSDLWAEVHYSGANVGKKDVYTADQLATLKPELLAKCQFAPGLVGSAISLYNAPEIKFQYKSDLLGQGADLSNSASLTGRVKSPDSTMSQTMFFPINVQNFGTLVKGDWWNGYTVYYPSVYLRVRMIYGIYGNFKYLWTEQVTEPWKVVDPVTGQVTYPGGLGFPKEIERQGTTVIHTPGVGANFEGAANWWTSPLTQFWSMLIVAVVVIIVVSIASPGLWTVLASRRGEGKGKSGSRGHKGR